MLAVVNDEIITERDVARSMAPVVKVARDLYRGAELAKRLAETRKGALQRLIEEKILYQEAQRVIGDDPARQRQVDRALEAHLKKLEEKAGSKEALREQIERGGMTPEEEHEKWRRWIMVEMILTEHVYRHVSVSPRDIRRYYRERIAEFTQKREVKFRWIVLIADMTDSDEKDQVRRVANSIADRLQRGASFERLAREYSDFRSDEGGLWDFTASGTRVPEVNEVLFRLKRGERSSVIESKHGFHLIEIVDARGGKRKSFEDVQGDIERSLKEQRTRELRQAYVSRLRENAYVQIRKGG